MAAALIGVAFAATPVPQAKALSIGEAEVRSAWAEPLHVVVPIELDGLAPEAVRVRAEPQAGFGEAGGTPPASAPLQATVERVGERAIVRLRGSQGVREPLLEVALELAGGGQQAARRLTLMFDPQSARESAAAPASEPAPSVAATPAPGAASAPAVAGAVTPAVLTMEAPAEVAPVAAAGTAEPALEFAAWIAPAAGLTTAIAGEARQAFGVIQQVDWPQASASRAPGSGVAFAMFLVSIAGFVAILRRARLGALEAIALPLPLPRPVPSARRELPAAAAKAAPGTAAAEAPSPAGTIMVRALQRRVNALRSQVLGEDSLHRRLFVAESCIENGELDEAEEMLSLIEKQVRRNATPVPAPSPARRLR